MDSHSDCSQHALTVPDQRTTARRDRDACSASDLLPLVYEQLRQLARGTLLADRLDQTLQATALVHEAYVRLAASKATIAWAGRWHFYAAAAEAMRRVLIDRARGRGRLKRGGDLGRIGLEEQTLVGEEPDSDVIALDEALSRLSQSHPEKAELVKLRFFGGLTVEEASQAMGISVKTAVRYWAYARAWLYHEVFTSSDVAQSGTAGGDAGHALH